MSAWDDTQVPFCVNQFCSNGLFDTGGTASLVISDDSDYGLLGVDDGATTFDPGAAVTETAGSTVSWSFTVGNPAVSGIDLFNFGSGAGGNGVTSNVGPAPFYQNDVFYDYALDRSASPQSSELRSTRRCPGGPYAICFGPSSMKLGYYALPAPLERNVATLDDRPWTDASADRVGRLMAATVVANVLR